MVGLSDQNLREYNARLIDIDAWVHNKNVRSKEFNIKSLSVRQAVYKFVKMQYESAVFMRFRKDCEDVRLTKSHDHFNQIKYTRSQSRLAKVEEIERKVDKETLSAFMYHQVGFAHVMRHLIKAKKPIVGHNMIFDVAHIFNMFIAPLPTHFS